MSLTLTIAAVNKTSLLDANSLQWHDELRVKNTITFKLTDASGAYRPAVGADVQLAKDGTTIFGGTVDEVTEEKEEGNNDCLRFQVTAIGYEEVFDRHVIYGAYEDHTCSEIIQHMIDDFMPDDGFTHANVMVGIVIGSIEINYMTASDVMEELCNQSGYSWYIDHNKDVHFFNRTAKSAPFGLTDTSANFRKMKVKYHRQNYRNIQWITGARGLTGSRTESFVGNGTDKNCYLSYPVAYAPTSITVDAAAMTIGILGLDTGKDWYWSKDSNVIAQDDGASALTSANVLAVTYEGLKDITTRVQNGEEIAGRAAIEGGDGYYEAVEEDTGMIGKDLTIERGSALVRRFGLMPVDVNFETDDDGLRAGQSIPVDITCHGIDGQYLITKVKGIDVDSKFMRYTVTAINGEPRGGWSTFFQMLGGRSPVNNVTVVGNERGVMMIGQAIARDALTVVARITLTATHDSFVQQENPSNNYGTLQYLNAGWMSGVTNRTFVKFNLAALAGKTVTSATLRLYSQSYLYGSGPQILGVHYVASDWIETGITWADMPVHNPTPYDTATVPADASLPAWVEFNVTGIVQNWISQGNNYGLCIRRETESGTNMIPQFRSSEDVGGNYPELVVEFI